MIVIAATVFGGRRLPTSIMVEAYDVYAPPVLIDKAQDFTLPKVPSRPSLRWKSLRYLRCSCLTGFSVNENTSTMGTVSIVDAMESTDSFDIFVFSIRRLITVTQQESADGGVSSEGYSKYFRCRLHHPIATFRLPTDNGGR